jgi:transposase
MIGRHYPGANVEIWAQDEARIGLVPIVRRIWAAKGERPIAQQRRAYEWVYVYGFVRPSTGQVEWLILPTVNLELFQLALDFFAEAAGATKRVVLIIDQAGWHTSKKLKIPAGLHLLPLPAYSPELQPAEKLWPLLHESVANEYIADMDALEDVLEKRCRELRAQPETIFGHTLFDWWAHAAEAERTAA